MEHRREVKEEEEIVEEKTEESPNEAHKSATFSDPTPQTRDLSVRGRCRAWEKGPAVSASLGAMRALVRKLDMLLLDPPHACSSESVKENMQLLKEDVEEISPCLDTLSQLEDPPQMAKCWMNEVRDLSYNLEDYIDSLHVQAAETSLAADSINTTRSHRKWFSRVRTPKKPTWDEQIVETVSEFRIYIHNAMKRHKMYGLQFFSTLRRTLVPFVHMLPTATSYEETSDIVVNDSMNKFINSLPNDGADQQQLKVVSVLGSSCLGKTTLARVLYKRIGLQFDCRAFVRVSKNPDMKKIFQDMLSQLERQQCPPQYSKEGDLINKIKNYLQGKRYLVIIDDLWSASVWDSINHAFPKVSHGSRIITTTQNEDIAFRCCHYQSEQVFEMKPLDDRHSRKLFFNRLFGSASKCPEQFKNVSNQIIALCGGLPLATIIIASLLASQPVMTEDLLQHIHESLSSLCSANPTSERTRQALNLSFNNLPQYLKTCLLYVSMYQEGYIFCQNDLVKQWMAEGFIDTTKGEDMEEVAKSYLHQLIGRRFIQPIRINYNNEVLSCAVHDVVHDLIAQKSAEDNFIVAIDHSEKNVAHPHKARRLSILFDDARYAKSPAYTIKSQVRSLTFVGLFECMPSITEFKLLRVLNLQLPGYGGCKGLCRDDNTVDLSVISELSRLRYLKIASHLFIKLPDYMGGLHCLETLDIVDAVVLKFGIGVRLPHLLHFYLSLHDEINVDNWIDKLKHLQELRLTFPSAGSSSQEENLLVLCDFISGHDNLKVIVVSCDSSDKVIDGTSDATISWDDMAPPPLLERFEFSPHRSCIFPRIPPWVEKHNNLSILKIAVKELRMICVGILRGLHALTALSLYVETMPAEKIIFDKPGFSVLKYIKLRFMSGVALLKFEADAMPNVLKLKLVFNAVPQINQYEHAIINIDHMPGLREICVKFVGAATGPEYALVSNHQSNPIINRQSSVCNSFDDKSTNQKLQTYEILKGEGDEIVEEERDDHGKESKTPVDQRILRSPVSSSRPHVPGMSASKRTMSSAATTGKLSTVSTSTFMASTVSGGSTDDGYVEDGHILESPNLRIFTFAELRGACNNFKPERVLGEGRFGLGKVYKGWIDGNPAKGSAAMVVAVKRLNPKSVQLQGMEQWQSEVNFLGRISHPNLVKLLGYCMEDNELLLVYEFMEKGSLENHLFERGAIYKEPLSWKLRLKILIGAARGLAFLHSSERQIFVWGFSASSILLDSHFNPKLSGFALAKHGPDDAESHFSTGHLCMKSDVYVFGIVLLEMLCGRMLGPDELDLDLSDRRRLTHLMDSRLKGQYHARGAFRVAQLAFKCMACELNCRPSMKEVVEALEQIEAMKSKSKSMLTSFFNNNVFRKGTTLKHHHRLGPRPKDPYPGPSSQGPTRLQPKQDAQPVKYT